MQKEIAKTILEINELKLKSIIKSMKFSWLFEKINDIQNPLDKLTKGEKIQI